MSRFHSFSFCVLLACAALVSGCGGAPSESEIKAAIEKRQTADMKAMQGLAGAAVAKSYLLEIKNVKKIGCKDDGEKAYRCDVELEVSQMGMSNKGAATLRFVRLSDGWDIAK